MIHNLNQLSIHNRPSIQNQPSVRRSSRLTRSVRKGSPPHSRIRSTRKNIRHSRNQSYENNNNNLRRALEASLRNQ
jgi:hypothetical protein